MSSHTLPVFVSLSVQARKTEDTEGTFPVMREVPERDHDRRLAVWLADGTLQPEAGAVMTEAKGRLLMGRRLKALQPLIDAIHAENPKETPKSGIQRPFWTVTSCVRTIFRGKDPLVAGFVTASAEEDVTLDAETFGRLKACFDNLVETAGLPAVILDEDDAFTVHELGALAGEHTVRIVTNALGEASRTMDTRVGQFVMDRDFPAGAPNYGQPPRI